MTSIPDATPAPADPAGPVTLVTGGTSGIGAEVGEVLLRAGHRVVLTGRNETAIRAWNDRGQRGEAVSALASDAADPTAAGPLVRAVLQRHGRLDNVVANAGYSTHDTIESGDPRQWAAMLSTNVLGPLALAQAALAPLADTSGRIVLVGSVAGVRHGPGNVYGVTKWAVAALAENLRQFTASRGVAVTHLAPGRVDTDFWVLPGESERNVQGPSLTGGQVADVVAWVLGQPDGVEINTVVMRPRGQQP